MTPRRLASLLLISLILLPSIARAALKVDISPDNGRKDVLTAGCENWVIKDGPTASKSFGDVTVTLRAGDRAGDLAVALWKGGLDTGATVSCDGVVLQGDLEMAISGLSPGRHSVVTYHSTLAEATPTAFDVLVDGKPQVRGARPTARVTNDYDAASCFVEVDATAGRDVMLTFKPAGSGSIILNGFAIDAADPTKQAIKPVPTNLDEHVQEDPILTWTPAKSAASHQAYLGTNKKAVENASPKSPEFKGDATDAKLDTSPLKLNSNDTYFWRVDEIASDKSTTRGEVWSFRVRHLAFPGAEGYGRFARGGRGGKVYEVTTLEDGGPGSLREAVEAEGPRTIVFRVGGTIPLAKPLVIRNPYCTVAGQTAPGDGICVRGAAFGNYATHDTIIRYVRTRVGDESGNTYDGMGFASSDACIIDHCSISWTIDESVSSRGAKNVTFQRNLIAEPLNMSIHKKYVGTGKGHSFAGSISGNIGSFHHNLLANAAGRNWSLAGGMTQGNRFAGYLDIRNNVVYNWEHRTNDGGVRKMNLVDNYYIPGPASRVFHLCIVEMEHLVDGDIQQYYIAGNMMEGKPEYDADNWKNGGIKDPQGHAARMKLNEPFCEPFVTTQAAKEAYENVMADVGCNYPRYDAVDQRVIKDVLSRKFTFKGSKTGTPGIIDSQKDVGGWPELKGGEAPADSDHDGMPDAWEKSNGLNANDASDGNKDSVGDGYTNLERYLNGIVAKGA